MSIRRRLVIFTLAVVVATLIDYLVIRSGFHVLVQDWLGTTLPVYHLVGWFAGAVFLVWLHQGLHASRWVYGFLGLAGGMPLFFMLEDFFYSILLSIYNGGHYPYPEFVGNWREEVFGSVHPLLGKFGAFGEQIWFWDLPAFFYIFAGWSLAVYLIWLVLNRRRRLATG